MNIFTCYENETSMKEYVEKIRKAGEKRERRRKKSHKTVADNVQKHFNPNVNGCA